MQNFEEEALDIKLVALQQQTDELLEKILNEQQKTDLNREKQANVVAESWVSLFNNNGDVFSELPKSLRGQILNSSSRFLGISFDDCSKEWVNDSCYLYKAVIKSKVLHFYLDLSVNLWDNGNFMVDRIKCQLVKTPKYCLNEVNPSVQTICAMKNFPLLLSAIYEYNSKYEIRSKILSHVEAQNYGNLEEWEGAKGGIKAHIHSPENPNKHYLDIHWTLLFSERSVEIVDFFSINSTDNGQDFVKKNKTLLEDFCALDISQENLIKLWTDLFAAIDVYEDDSNLSIKAENNA